MSPSRGYEVRIKTSAERELDSTEKALRVSLGA
jgi:hypothetical protein